MRREAAHRHQVVAVARHLGRVVQLAGPLLGQGDPGAWQTSLDVTILVGRDLVFHVRMTRKPWVQARRLRPKLRAQALDAAATRAEFMAERARDYCPGQDRAI